MTPPHATYRFQLTEDFGFDRVAEVVDYVARLGASHLHLSPILTARPGSRHFADVADHSQVDPVLGGEDGLRTLAEQAHEAGLGLIGTIVPNHMGVGPWSPLWELLLAGGRSSRAANFFDVDWEPPLPGAADKVILPVLGDPYGDVLVAGGLTLTQTSSGVRVCHGDLSFPVSVTSERALERSGLEDIAGVAGEERTWGRMHSLLEQQHYRLVSWRAGVRLVNYRRYLDIDELAALRVEDEAVFNDTHETMIRLVTDGVFDGVRIDHIDGLADPAKYLHRLRDRLGPDRWMVVEAVTTSGQVLPEDWPVAGTTGYELLRTALGLHVDPRGMHEMRRLAREHDALPTSQDRARMKAEVLDGSLGPDLRRCTREFWIACQEEPAVRDVDYRTLLEAITLLAAGLPRHRTYLDPATGATSTGDIDVIAEAVSVARAETTGRDIPDRLWTFLERLLTGQVRWTAASGEAVTRFQQLTVPVSMLGREERLFARHNALVSACEVGCDPDDVPRTLAQAHQEIAAMPVAGMRSTATHDTRHGEDVRLRMAALTGMAEEWRILVSALLTPRPPVGPSLGLRLLQVAVGIWPISDNGTGELIDVLDTPLRDRFVTHAVGCARSEAILTSVQSPAPAAEETVAHWAAGVLDPQGPIAPMLRPIALRAAEVAMAAGLSQTLLRLTVPGVPDTYQGTEWWDDSLGLPDNRRPVNFVARITALEDLRTRIDDGAIDADGLWRTRRDARVKQHVTHVALALRRRYPDILGPAGTYTPIQASGRWADHMLVFARGTEAGPGVIVVAPRVFGRVTESGRFAPRGRIWADTDIPLPDTTAWTDLLTGHTVSGGAVPAATLLATLPVALLLADSRR